VHKADAWAHTHDESAQAPPLQRGDTFLSLTKPFRLPGNLRICAENVPSPTVRRTASVCGARGLCRCVSRGLLGSRSRTLRAAFTLARLDELKLHISAAGGAHGGSAKVEGKVKAGKRGKGKGREGGGRQRSLHNARRAHGHPSPSFRTVRGQQGGAHVEASRAWLAAPHGGQPAHAEHIDCMSLAA